VFGIAATRNLSTALQRPAPREFKLATQLQPPAPARGGIGIIGRDLWSRIQSTTTNNDLVLDIVMVTGEAEIDTIV